MHDVLFTNKVESAFTFINPSSEMTNKIKEEFAWGMTIDDFSPRKVFERILLDFSKYLMRFL
jgi:hypothetical protein